MPASGSSTTERLVELGFSQYEARAYVGLLGSAPLTGYALSNSTGIPQPKVYETLRRLARKGVAIALEGEPLRFVAVPPAQVLAHLDTNFRRRLADAELGLMQEVDGTEKQLRVFDALSNWAAVARQAVELLDGSTRHVYMSINCDSAPFLEAVGRAVERGVKTDLLHFGKEELAVEHGRSLRHATTDGVVYRHHQARHLAIVADSTKVLWALAPSGQDWQAVSGDDNLLAAAIKGYVRHDMYVQQISQDFGELLEARYGPGLEKLVMPIKDGAPEQAVSGAAGGRRPKARKRAQTA
jgi:sugar-specific transcriptional regulator TrmB